MEPKGTTPLADISRQRLLVGNPPMLLFTPAGVRLDRELVALSTQIRIAEALERVAAALEVNPQLSLGAVQVNLEGSQSRG